jgi:hypothetical protein
LAGEQGVRRQWHFPEYRALGTLPEAEFAGNWALVRGVLEHAERKLTRPELRERWPAGKAPDDTTLYRWLERAVAAGQVRQDGRGRRGSPLRYLPPARAEQWRKDPLGLLNLLEPPG